MTIKCFKVSRREMLICAKDTVMCLISDGKYLLENTKPVSPSGTDRWPWKPLLPGETKLVQRGTVPPGTPGWALVEL